MVRKFFAKNGLVLLIGLGIGAVAGFVVVGVLYGDFSFLNTGQNSPEIASIGSKAPDFSLLSLEDEMIRLSSFQGKAVMVNFWATWCGPCRLEMPMIEKFHQDYRDQLVILAVNMQEDERAVHIFANELDLDFYILLDRDSEVSDLFRVKGLPTTYFIDPEGEIAAAHVGALSEEQVHGYLEKVGLSR
jgi:thiol-disulfide isomerase/thioredoxin